MATSTSMKYVKYGLGGLLAVIALLVVIGMIIPTEEPESATLYARAPVPAVPERTAAVATDLADGDYWAEAVTLADGRFTFTLMQALFGEACVEELGADECANDYSVLPEPTRELTVALAADTPITVTADSMQNYVVFADELARLLAGAAPAAAAPGDYTYVPFPYLVTVRDGEVVELHQIWVP